MIYDISKKQEQQLERSENRRTLHWGWSILPLVSVAFGAGSLYGRSQPKPATVVPVITVTEQYSSGNRITRGTVSAWGTGDGSNWYLTYRSDGVFIDCKK